MGWGGGGCHSIPPPSYVRGLNELGSSLANKTQVKNHILCITQLQKKQHNKSIIQSNFKTPLLWICNLPFYTQYHLSAFVQPFLTCTWFEVATNKIAQFFGTGTGYVKLKKKHGNFSTTMETKLDIRPSSRVIKQIWSFNENVQTCWETYEVQMCSEFQENSLCLRKLSFFRIACLGDCWLNCWIGLRAFTAPD